MDIQDYNDALFTHLKNNDLSQICRLCLSPNEQMNGLFSYYKLSEDTTEKYIHQMIFSFTQIQMVAEDGLPQVICEPCTLRTAAAFNLRNQVQRSDRVLKTFVLHQHAQLFLPIPVTPVLKRNDLSEIKLEHCDSSNRDDHRLLPMDLESDTRSMTQETDDIKTNDNKITKATEEPKLLQATVVRHNTRYMVTRSKANSNTRSEIEVSYSGEHPQTIDLPISGQITGNTDFGYFKKPTKSHLSKHFMECTTKPEDEHGTRIEACLMCPQEIQPGSHSEDDAPNECTHSLLEDNIKDECQDTIQDTTEDDKETSIMDKPVNKLKKKPREVYAPLYERPDEPQVCSVCLVSCSNVRELTRHRSDTHGPKKYQCITCGNGFTTTRGLRIHLRLHTGERPEVCSLCGKAFSDPRTLRNHERTHSGNHPFSCPVCEKRFPARLPLAHHLLSHSGERPHRCQLCPRAYVQASSLQVHMRSHTGVKPYPCLQCSKAFTNNTSLSVHMLTHNGVKNFQCPVCGKRMARSGELTVHLRTHSGEKPFPCTLCRKAFTNSSALRIHMPTHTGVKNYVCTVCGKRVARAMELRVHMRTHTGERHYACSHCPRRFSTSSNMRLHERQHTGERPYVCSVCNRGFADSHVLRNHERTHSGSRPFACTLCPRAFSQQTSLRAHQASHKVIQKETLNKSDTENLQSSVHNEHPKSKVQNIESVYKPEIKNANEEFLSDIKILESDAHSILPILDSFQSDCASSKDLPSISIINSELLNSISGKSFILHRNPNQIFNESLLKPTACMPVADVHGDSTRVCKRKAILENREDFKKTVENK